MFLNKLAALAALPLAVSLVGGAALAQSKEPVTIGAIEILTGPNNKYGVAIKNGFDLALESVNKNGGVLGGRPLAIAYEDSAGNNRALRVAREVSGH